MIRTIKCSKDLDLIKKLLKEDYNQVTYDGCPEYSEFVPEVENCIWFMLYADKVAVGLIKLDNLNFTTFIPHIVIKKEFRGPGSEQWGQLVVQYMKDRISDANFLVMTPYENAKNYAQKVGFHLIGMLPKSIKKEGKLMDQYILGGPI